VSPIDALDGRYHPRYYNTWLRDEIGFNCFKQEVGRAGKFCDVQRLAKYLHVKPARIMAEYVVESEEQGLILRRDKQTGCVFLSGNECTVYDSRPESCQKFPHVVRGNGSIASRMWELIDRACYCPIVYNSLEAFKDDMGFKR